MLLELLGCAGISQRRVCQKLGISYPTLHRWNEDISWMRLGEVKALLDALPLAERRQLAERLGSLFLNEE